MSAAQRTDDRRARLAELLRRRAAGGAEHPLSHGQRALWLTQRLEPESWAYNAVFAARVRSDLDARALGRALGRLVRRHPTLRTRYPERDGEPVAVVEPDDSVELVVADGPAAAVERRQRVIEEARRPFDLAAAPPVRMRLWRGGRRDHHLLIAAHHVAVDGWSMWMLLDELVRLYGAEIGEPVEVPEAPRATFADHVHRERRLLASEERQRLERFWLAELEGAPREIDLPFDFTPTGDRSRHGDSRAFCIDGETAAGVRALAQDSGVTPYLVLLAVFQVLLARYSGQDEVVVGSPVAGRPGGEFDAVAGYFVNPLPIRGRLAGEPTFRTFLARLRDTFLSVHEHRELPFPVLVERLGIGGEGHRAPLFQTFFTFQRPQRLADRGVISLLLGDEGSAVNLGGLELESVGLPQQEGQFDLTLQMAESGEGLVGQLGFDPERIAGATAERMVDHFRNLLAAAAGEPDRSVFDLPLMDEDERRRVHSWSALGDHPRDATLHGLVEEQARRHPESVAIRYGGEAVTYGELQRHAAATAAVVAPRVDIGDRVALLLPEGPRLVAAMFGVLRAGGCFVCLDPRLPELRSAELLARADARVLLHDGDERGSAPILLRSLPDGAEPPVSVRLPRDLAAGEPSATGSGPAGPEDPAYVAFTSGSSGEPKGIVQSHASFCQFLRWQADRFAVAPGTRWAQWATATYDAAYCEIFGTLGFGGTLLLADPEVRHDPRRLLTWMGDEDADLLQTVPSFFRELLDAVDAGDAEASVLRSLDSVLLAGEVLPPDLVRRFFRCSGGDVPLYNLYGPSETVLATWHRVTPDDLAAGAVPVGRAIDGRQILVLDPRGALCPPGIRGEIVVRSPHLTLGYLGRPDLTRRVFTQNPLAAEEDDPVYRTGDLGRWRPDGLLEYRGRVDGQVKVRGMRVEPAEIEAVLRLHPALRDAAVTAPERPGGERWLAAWVVPRDEPPAAAELRRHLRRRLPPHMVPTSFVVLEELPRTATGKLDRKALPEPDAVAPDAEYRAPQEGLEAEVAALWGELLGAERVGRDDDFFALGGHSLLANRLIHAVAERYGVELPLRTLFEAPTLAAFAGRLHEELDSEAQAADRMLDLLQRVEELSDDEVHALLNAERVPGAEVGANRDVRRDE